MVAHNHTPWMLFHECFFFGGPYRLSMSHVLFRLDDNIQFGSSLWQCWELKNVYGHGANQSLIDMVASDPSFLIFID
jgi:hypothetical protein